MTRRRAWDGRSAPTGRPGTPWLATPLVLLVSALILTVSLAAVGFRARQQLKLDEQSQRVSVWYTTQALVELHRLRSALLLRERGDGAADQIDVGERYDILLSRLPLLLQGEEATAEALTDRADMVHGIIDMLTAIEPDMLAWTPGAKATKARIEATLHEAEALLTQLNLALHVERQGAVVAARAHAADLNLAGLGGMGGLVLAGAMLLALLRRHARRALAAEAMLRALMDALPVAVSAYDRDGRVTLMNRASLSLLGHAEEAAVIGRTAAEVGAAREATAEIEQALRSGEVLPPSETVLDQPDGTQRHLLVTTAPVLGAGRLACLVRVGLDITEQRRADHRARHLEEHDPLTNLANRARFGALLGAALAELAEGEMLAVHCIDLDGFKQVNESLGHATGDRLLLAAGARIQGTLREGDLLARFGGDEFAVIQTRLSGRGEAEALANRLCRVLARAYRIEGQTLRSGASIGIVLAPEHGLASEALLSRADIALRAAKAAGRGRAKVFDPAQESGLKERLEIEECLRNALSERQLRLAYQPKFSAASGALHGCEALLRWYHPSRGPIPPSVFIPVAEAAGLMEELTRQVLDMACRQAAAWAETGLHLPIAVNLSGAQFGAGEGVAMLRAALDASGCRPELIEVEVTEGVFLQDQAAAGESFAAMRALGVRIALDDFGTGFSSLGYLQHLRFDVIKIDRSFVGGIEHGGAGRRIVDAIVRLAHGLGAEVVAEGVETEAQLATLRALECDVVQGYLLARPMPPEQVAALRAPPPAAMPRVA